MKQEVLYDSLHDGLIYQVFVPVEACEGIEHDTDHYIKFTIGNAFDVIGLLKNVSTWSKKEKGEIIQTYKRLKVEVEGISCKTAGKIRFPDRKSEYVENVEIIYNVRANESMNQNQE